MSDPIERLRELELSVTLRNNDGDAVHETCPACEAFRSMGAHRTGCWIGDTLARIDAAKAR